MVVNLFNLKVDNHARPVLSNTCVIQHLVSFKQSAFFLNTYGHGGNALKDMERDILKTALRKGLSGEGLSKEEAGEFVKLPDSSVFEILPVTEKVRREKKGDEVPRGPRPSCPTASSTRSQA